METPLIKLSNEELEAVYEPAEDSFLLIDALEADLSSIKVKKEITCLEIGSGSGVIITALAMALKKDCKGYFLAVDVNPKACSVTQKTASLNCVEVEVVRMDLLSCINDKKMFDIIVFNPPYVPTENSEIHDDKFIYKSWAGGDNGRKVMERVFPKIPILLSDSGMFYLLVIKENNPEYIINYFHELGMSGEVVKERKIRGEHLYVLRFKR